MPAVQLGPRHHFDRVLLVSGDRESEVAHLAGQVGITPDGKVAEGLKAQVEAACDNLLAILAAEIGTVIAPGACTMLGGATGSWKPATRPRNSSSPSRSVRAAPPTINAPPLNSADGVFPSGSTRRNENGNRRSAACRRGIP